MTNFRKMKVKKERAGSIQTAVKRFLAGSAGTTLYRAPRGASNAAPKQRKLMKTMTQARAMEVAGEELKTVPLEGTSRHSETSAPKYASNPPLAQIMGRNQAMMVRPSAVIPSSILFTAAVRSE